MLIHIAGFENGRIKGGKSYYAEPGDRVSFTLFKSVKNIDSLVFRGKGAGKYNLTEYLTYDFSEFETKRKALNLKDTANLNQALLKHARLVEDYTTRKYSLIDQYKDSLSKNSKIMVEYETANYYEDWTWFITNLFCNKK